MRIATPAALALVVAASLPALLLGGGCLKEKDSLVIVALTADTPLAGPLAVRITVGNVTQTFQLATGLNPTPAVQRGVYIDSKETGPLALQATTQVGTNPCILYASGPGNSVQVPSAGSTVNVALTLTNSGKCATGGGTGGGNGVDAGNDGNGSGGTSGGTGGQATGGTTGSTGGTTGAGGTIVGGSGGTTGVGGNPGGPMPPSLALASCHEFTHSAGTDCTGLNDAVIYTVSVSPNGALVATAGSDSRTKIWRFDGHTLTPEGHVFTGAGFAVAAFSPDGTTLAIGWQTGIDLWTVSSWTRTRTLTTASQVYDLAFTSDSQQILSIDSTTLYAHTVTAIPAVHTAAIPEGTWVIAASPTSTAALANVAVATTSGTVRLFIHSATGFVASPSILTVSPGGSKTLAVRFSPDGKLVAASSSDGLVHLWNYPITSTTPTAPDIDVGTPTDSDDMDAIEFFPGGKYLAVGGGFFQSVSTWNTAAPRAIIASYLNPSSDIQSMAFSPTGAALLAGEYSCGAVLVCAD